MSFTCKSFMKIASQFHIRLLNSHADLTRPVSWLHYLEDPVYTDWLRGKELVVTTGVLLGAHPDRYCRLIDAIYSREAAGLIINLSPYITRIPKEVIDYADFLGFPLFEMPPKSAIVEVSESVGKALLESSARQSKCAGLLYSLIYDNPKISSSFIKRAVVCGYNPDSSYSCMLFNLTCFPISFGGPLYDETIDNDRLAAFENELFSIFDLPEGEVLNLHLKNQILWLVPAHKAENSFLKNSLPDRLLQYGEKHDIHITAGISPLWKELHNFRSSYQKAFEALHMVPCSVPYTPVLLYDDLDALSILLSKCSASDKEALQSPALKILSESDSETGSELVATIRAYIQHNGSFQDTAAFLFIHVNTLRYRLRKIEELLGCSLKDWNTIFTLTLEFRIMDYLHFSSK